MFILASSEACGLISETTVNFIASLIKAIKYLVPILLIVMGSLDFVKATLSQKDDELKDAKTKFINKLVAGIAVFFVFSFVTWLVNLLAENFGIKSLECVNSFLSGSYKESDIDDMSGNKFEQCLRECKEEYGENAQAYGACSTGKCNQYTTTKKGKTTTTATTTTTDKHQQEMCYSECQEKKQIHFKNECVNAMNTNGKYELACASLENKLNKGDTWINCEDVTMEQAKLANAETEYSEYKQYEKQYGVISYDNTEKDKTCNTFADNAVNNQNKKDEYCQWICNH